VLGGKDFIQFVKELQMALKEPLPGVEVQYEMAPVGRDVDPGPGMPRPKESAVTALLFPEDDGVKLLLMKRVEDDTIHSAQLSFPGGQKEKNDKDLLDTALREMKEEVGISREDVEVIGRLTPLYISVSNFMVFPFVAYCDHTPDFHLNRAEVEKVIKADISRLLMPGSKTYRSVTTKYLHNFEVPCFSVDGEVLWGATAMMTHELLEVMKKVL
jgi:8-oxo-dGTP pyrophosphatase MutT (NUDIX family)